MVTKIKDHPYFNNWKLEIINNWKLAIEIKVQAMIMHCLHSDLYSFQYKYVATIIILLYLPVQVDLKGHSKLGLNDTSKHSCYSCLLRTNPMSLLPTFTPTEQL